MSTLKRCSGHKGHWECAEEYPDHMVPLENFSVDNNAKNGLQRPCKKCTKHAHKFRNRYPDPVTGMDKSNWKRSYAKSLGGVRPDKPGHDGPVWRECIKQAGEAWKEHIKHTNVVPLKKKKEKLLKKKKEKLPKIYKEINKNPPRESIIYPKEGYVYIFKSDDMDSIKIGKTDDVGKRLSAAQTWGRYKCLYYKMSEDCKLLEKNVHDVLFHRRVVEENLGSEHFRVNLEYAKKVIDHEAARIQSEDDREGPRLGRISG